MKTKIFLLLAFTCSFTVSHAQEPWASWANSIPVKEYEGKRFRLQADVRTEIVDDSAASRIWARVDKTDEKNGFFDNMMKRPVRNKEWSTYSIEGKIDTGATILSFGALVEKNGRFYYDNFKIEVEKSKNKWATIYSEDFEKASADWKPGINKPGTSGISKLFTSTFSEGRNGGKAFEIIGEAVPSYGHNKSVGKFADVNGIKLYYEIYGDGLPLVVLHGNGGSIESAASHYPDLIKKYKVIAIDSRAQGRSTDTDKPLTYDAMASDVNALLEQLKIDSAYIWGQSDGAILCLVMAMDYPKKVKRVVAYAPNVTPDSSAIYGWAYNWVIRTARDSKDKTEKKLFELMRDYPNIPLEKLNSIKAPCLIMGGDRDVIRLEHLVKMFQHIPNSHLCILPGSTHGGAWEKKELFLQIMNDFFNKPFTMPDTASWVN